MAPAETALATALPLPLPAPVAAPATPRPRRDVARTMADLHAAHGDELRRFCRWMLKDAEDAADALQDTWIRAMTALGADGVAVTALRPWLYAIARNVCLDRLRDRKRRSLADLDESSAGETPGADDVVALRQEAGAALALVGQLSERQRSALLMRELAGMSVPEIAAALGLTADRAAWAIADARRALEEARAGDTMACEDARARLAAGHRGRTLRAHLGRCSACMTHDRRLRSKRVLAPALLPLLWLKRLALPLLANPASAATVAAVAITAGATAPHPPAHAPQAWAAQTPHAVVSAAQGARPEGPAPVATPSRAETATRGEVAAPAANPARAESPAPAVPPASAETPAPAAPPSSTIDVPATTRAAAETVTKAVSAVAESARGTVQTVAAMTGGTVRAAAETVAALAPAAAPATQNVQDTASAVLDRIG